MTASTVSRIASAFERARAENRAALMPFLTVGYPTIEASKAWLLAIAEGGADLIEIGIAGSDFYTVFETDGTVKWQRKTQDFSSGMTGSTNKVTISYAAVKGAVALKRSVAALIVAVAPGLAA